MHISKDKILDLLWHLDPKRCKTQVLARIKCLRCTCKGKSHVKQLKLCTSDLQRNLLPALYMSIYLQLIICLPYELKRGKICGIIS